MSNKKKTSKVQSDSRSKCVKTPWAPQPLPAQWRMLRVYTLEQQWPGLFYCPQINQIGHNAPVSLTSDAILNFHPAEGAYEFKALYQQSQLQVSFLDETLYYDDVRHYKTVRIKVGAGSCSSQTPAKQLQPRISGQICVWYPRRRQSTRRLEHVPPIKEDRDGGAQTCRAIKTSYRSIISSKAICRQESLFGQGSALLRACGR